MHQLARHWEKEFDQLCTLLAHSGRTLYIADFDVPTRTVSDPKAITDQNPDPKLTWLYPRWGQVDMQGEKA